MNKTKQPPTAILEPHRNRNRSRTQQIQQIQQIQQGPEQTNPQQKGQVNK
jgi:hypothetical protein